MLYTQEEDSASVTGLGSLSDGKVIGTCWVSFSVNISSAKVLCFHTGY